MMAGMDGYEVCKQLKALPDTKDIPVIFATALSDENDETNAEVNPDSDFKKYHSRVLLHPITRLNTKGSITVQ